MTTLADALADCLEAQARGEDLEGCLARYAEHREELVMLLDVVRRVQATRPSTDLAPNARERITELVRQVLTPDVGSKPPEGEKYEGSE